MVHQVSREDPYPGHRQRVGWRGRSTARWGCQRRGRQIHSPTIRRCGRSVAIPVYPVGDKHSDDQGARAENHHPHIAPVAGFVFSNMFGHKQSQSELFIPAKPTVPGIRKSFPVRCCGQVPTSHYSSDGALVLSRQNLLCRAFVSNCLSAVADRCPPCIIPGTQHYQSARYRSRTAVIKPSASALFGSFSREDNSVSSDIRYSSTSMSLYDTSR